MYRNSKINTMNEKYSEYPVIETATAMLGMSVFGGGLREGNKVDVKSINTKLYEQSRQGQKDWCIDGVWVKAATKKAAIKKAKKLNDKTNN